MRKPTEIYNHVWLYVRNPNIPEDINPDYIGKWLIFLSEDMIDHYFEVIAEETIAGSLGIGAKASTQLRDKELYDKFVICVYTADYRDEEDVYRVRKRLKELGFRKKLDYKTDEATRNGTNIYRYSK
jgi:hypothetical protein